MIINTISWLRRCMVEPEDLAEISRKNRNLYKSFQTKTSNSWWLICDVQTQSFDHVFQQGRNSITAQGKKYYFHHNDYQENFTVILKFNKIYKYRLHIIRYISERVKEIYHVPINLIIFRTNYMPILDKKDCENSFAYKR